MNKKNTILILALALVFFVLMAYWLSTAGFSGNILFQREIRQLETQSESDEVQAIEKDLEETDLSNIDQELSDIEKELNAAY